MALIRMWNALLHQDISSAVPVMGTAMPSSKPRSRFDTTTRTRMFTSSTSDDIQHPRIIPIRHPWKRVFATERVAARPRYSYGNSTCRIPGKEREAWIQLAMRSRRVFCSRIEPNEALEAAEDLLKCGVKILYSFSSPVADVLLAESAGRDMHVRRGSLR